jgi:hypothetical protein
MIIVRNGFLATISSRVGRLGVKIAVPNQAAALDSIFNFATEASSIPSTRENLVKSWPYETRRPSRPRDTLISGAEYTIPCDEIDMVATT